MQTPGSISVVKGNNQTAVLSEAVRDSIVFRVLDTESAPIPNMRVNFTVSAGSLASPNAMTNSAGEVLLPTWTMASGETEGAATVTASVEEAPSVTTQATANAVISHYDIRLVYVNSGTPSQQAVFAEAVRRWRGIISSELSNVALTIDPSNPDLDCGTAPSFNETVDDLVIFVDLVNIDGPGQVLGSAGPCFIRNSNQLTIAGIMRFDTSDLPALEARNQLDEVVIHEMGHVLGVGSLWVVPGPNGTFTKNFRDNSNTADPIFTGPLAQAAFTSSGIGGGGCSCRPVPIEGGNNPGSSLVHWRESVLTRELMSPFLQSIGSNPLSLVTIASLQDYGYQVRTAKAEAYSISAAIMSEFAAPPQGTLLVEADVKGPIKAVDDHGRVMRLYPRNSAKQ